MTDEMMNLRAFVEKTLMEMEVGVEAGAAHGERSGDRLAGPRAAYSYPNATRAASQCCCR
jgi:hypothetical protein